jgi:hypothetical protein
MAERFIRTITQRAGLRPACCVLILLGATFIGRAQDSTSVDTLYTPLASHGRLGIIPLRPFTDITKRDVRKIQYYSLPEIVTTATPWMPMSAGGLGQHNSMSIAGAMPVDIAVSENGRSLVDVWSGTMHLEQLAPEGFDRAELYLGTDAVALSATMSTVALNLQDVQHNTGSPFSKLWYHQAGGDYIAADMELTQNVAPNVNVMFGVRRAGANGRYARTKYDVWNIRSAVRWSISSMSTVSLNYHASSLSTDLWGGINANTNTQFDNEGVAQPVYAALRDDSRRHDLTLTFTQLLASDTSSVLTATAYGTLNAMNRMWDSSGYTLHSHTEGATVRLEQRLSILTLRVGASADYTLLSDNPIARSIDNVSTSAFGHATLRLQPALDLKASARITSQYGVFMNGGGAGIVWRADSATTVTADASTAQRAPTPTEGPGLLPERSGLLFLDFAQRIAPHGPRPTVRPTTFSMGLYARITDNPLITSAIVDTAGIPVATKTINGSTSNVYGGYVHALFRLWELDVEPIARISTSQLQGSADDRFPIVSGSLSLSYTYRVGSNWVVLGVRGGLLSSMRGLQHVPVTWTYIQPTVQQGTISNGLDAWLVANLGNANVRLSFENIFGQPFYTVAMAPFMQQNIRLSVTWSFFE